MLPAGMFHAYNQNRRTCIETYQNLAYKFSDAAVNTSLPVKERRYYTRQSFKTVKKMRSISYKDIAVVLGVAVVAVELFIQICSTTMDTVKQLPE